MWTQTGACPRCGAHIFVPTVWHGVIPPAAHHSCSCNWARSRTWTTSTTRTTTGAAIEEADRG